METKDTAVALLKEWKHQEIASNPFSSWAWVPEYQKELSQRLDEISGASGISIINGRFVQNYALLNVDHTPHGSTCWLDLPAREQQAIQEWLLIKNEEKTA